MPVKKNKAKDILDKVNEALESGGEDTLTNREWLIVEAMSESLFSDIRTLSSVNRNKKKEES